MKHLAFISLGTIQLFVALGAIVSGVLLIISPSGALLHAPPQMLKNSPFSDFLVPGIILLIINGVGQLAAGVLTFRRHRLAGYAGAMFGIGLMIWIFVQVNMIGGRQILQYGYFFLGVVETVLAFLVNGFCLEEKTIPFLDTNERSHVSIKR